MTKPSARAAPLAKVTKERGRLAAAQADTAETKAAKLRLPGFAKWIEGTIQLPVGLAAEPGPIKLPPYMREIAEALIDPAVERVTLQKAARVGFTTIVVGAIAHLEAIEWPEGHPARALRYGFLSEAAAAANLQK
jgi:hypothetical protein